MLKEQGYFDDKDKVLTKQETENYKVEPKGAKVFIYGGERIAFWCGEVNFDEWGVPVYEGQKLEQFAAYMCEESLDRDVYVYCWAVCEVRVEGGDERKVWTVYFKGHVAGEK